VWLLKAIFILTQVELFSKQRAVSLCKVVQCQWRVAAASAATGTGIGKRWENGKYTDYFGNKQTVWFMEWAIKTVAVWW